MGSDPRLYTESLSVATEIRELEWVPGIFLGGGGGGKKRPARRADNLTAICEPIV
jgi:hypothetical protein